jgi:hypothetical protein
LNKELSQELGKRLKKKLPALELTVDDMCHVTIITLSTMARFFRKQATFSSARLLEYARESVNDFLEERINEKERRC